MTKKQALAEVVETLANLDDQELHQLAVHVAGSVAQQAAVSGGVCDTSGCLSDILDDLDGKGISVPGYLDRADDSEDEDDDIDEEIEALYSGDPGTSPRRVFGDVYFRNIRRYVVNTTTNGCVPWENGAYPDFAWPTATELRGVAGNLFHAGDVIEFVELRTAHRRYGGFPFESTAAVVVGSVQL